MSTRPYSNKTIQTVANLYGILGVVWLASYQGNLYNLAVPLPVELPMQYTDKKISMKLYLQRIYSSIPVEKMNEMKAWYRMPIYQNFQKRMLPLT